MLFTTAAFAFLFLPLALAGFFALGRWNQYAAAGWLLMASLFFYGWWMPQFTLLLVSSIVVNFSLGRSIAAAHQKGLRRSATWALASGIIFNLSLLAYFKYANFFMENVGELLGHHWAPLGVVLPIGISFYTFTQIAFLCDAWHGKVDEVNPIHYGLFVTYFPHLIAGPVLHHAQMMPQFGLSATYRPHAANLAAGLAIFLLGLVKKVVLADGIAPFADAAFDGVASGRPITVNEAWLGAFAYSFQLYFDFSGYSDMAIGLSLMFNVRLPFNFDSPYRATSISDFWRRWHMSLSNFLRDYLYIPLGGNRHGPARRYLNLAVTMLLGGLWHGASWSFVIWGGLHGAYLGIHHAFVAVSKRWQVTRGGWLATPSRVAAWALTMLCVLVAWVFFRAKDLQVAIRVLEAMAGSGHGPDGDVLLWNAGLSAHTGWTWCLLLGLLSVVGPNSNTIGVAIERHLAQSRPLREALFGASVCAAASLVVLNAARDAVSAFIYFNF